MRIEIEVKDETAAWIEQNYGHYGSLKFLIETFIEEKKDAVERERKYNRD